MNIVYELDDVFTAGSSPLENAHVLRGLLDCLIQADLAYLRSHSCPKLYSSGVRYGRTHNWMNIPAVQKYGFTDCKSLSAWRAAELIHERAFGQNDPKTVFRWVRRDGIGVPDYHILVMTPKGWECPSAKLGMTLPETHYFR
jgi:hypothetical protein